MFSKNSSFPQPISSIVIMSDTKEVKILLPLACGQTGPLNNAASITLWQVGCSGNLRLNWESSGCSQPRA